MPTRRFMKFRPASHAALAAAGLIAVAAVGFAGAAGAADPEQRPSVTVRYSDLDITTARGADVLYRRISSAAAKVCPDADPIELARYQRVKLCRQQAIDRAVESIHSPLLAAVSAAHHHGV